MTDILTTHAAHVGQPYGMTADQVIAYIALGDRPHGDAPPGECGAVDPRDETRWCRRPPNHERWMHCCYRLDEDWPEGASAYAPDRPLL